METTLSLTAISLECIDGKDDHFKIDVLPGETVVFSSNGNDTLIKELENQGGAIIVSNQDGKMIIDATDCAVPVKINGNMVIRNELRVHDVLRIGNSIWRINPPAMQVGSHSAVTNIRKGFTSFIGLEELKDFKLQSIFQGIQKTFTGRHGRPADHGNIQEYTCAY